MSKPIVPCPHCGGEMYDNIGLLGDHAVCGSCLRDVCYPPHEVIDTLTWREGDDTYIQVPRS